MSNSRVYALTSSRGYDCTSGSCVLMTLKAPLRGAAEENELGEFRPASIDRMSCNTKSDCLKDTARCGVVDEKGYLVENPGCSKADVACMVFGCKGYCISNQPAGARPLLPNENLDEENAKCDPKSKDKNQCKGGQRMCKRCVVPSRDRHAPVQFMRCNNNDKNYCGKDSLCHSATTM